MLALIVVVIVLGGMWYVLYGGSSAPAPSLTTTGTGSGNPADQTLVSTLLALRAVKLNATIFSNPAFMSLKDFSTQIVPEPVGRPDPFAPLAASTSASANTTRSAQIFSPRVPAQGGR